MFIQSSTSLVDYLNDPNKAQQTLSQLGKSPGKSVYDELAHFKSALSDNSLDETLKKIETGDSSISLKTIENMIAFNKRPVANELQDFAARQGIYETLSIQRKDDKWILGFNSKTADLTEDEQQQIKRIQQYLDASPKLQQSLDQLNRLSQHLEWGKARNYATELKEADFTDEQVAAFLKSSREQIKATNGVTFNSADFVINAEGKADTKFRELTKKEEDSE